jgi:hypothetical protein
MIDLTKPVVVIATANGYADGDRFVDHPMFATFYTALPKASAEVSRLAKAGHRNLRVLKFADGEVTNLKE